MNNTRMMLVSESAYWYAVSPKMQLPNPLATAAEKARMLVKTGVDRMDAEVCQRRQHFRIVVHLVEFPQQRDLVTEPMIEPVAELVGEKQHDRDDGARHVGR